MPLGTLLLAIWLIVTGLAAFTRLVIPFRDKLLGGLALLAGVFMILGR